MNKSGSYPILDTINSPADVRKLKKDQLKPLAKELREYLTHTVSISGGHFSAGLGTVELTVALHYVFDTPSDQLVWDVGHQAYPHKILTGRKERMTTIRTRGWRIGVSQPGRERIRRLWGRPFQHLDQCRLRHGDSLGTER